MTYDYPALEKHLVDRFIHGKPLIQLEIPQVVYRKDVYSAMTFANIRKKVKPQVSHMNTLLTPLTLKEKNYMYMREIRKEEKKIIMFSFLKYSFIMFLLFFTI